MDVTLLLGHHVQATTKQSGAYPSNHPLGGNRTPPLDRKPLRVMTPKTSRSRSQTTFLEDFSRGRFRSDASDNIDHAGVPEVLAVAVSGLRDGAVDGWAASPEETFPVLVRVEKIGKGKDFADQRASTTSSKVNHILEIPQALSGRQSVETLRHSHGQIKKLFLITSDAAAARGVRRTFGPRLLLRV